MEDMGGDDQKDLTYIYYLCFFGHNFSKLIEVLIHICKVIEFFLLYFNSNSDLVVQTCLIIPILQMEKFDVMVHSGPCLTLPSHSDGVKIQTQVFWA